jgi:hypothetical protein
LEVKGICKGRDFEAQRQGNCIMTEERRHLGRGLVLEGWKMLLLWGAGGYIPTWERLLSSILQSPRGAYESDS